MMIQEQSNLPEEYTPGAALMTPSDAVKFCPELGQIAEDEMLLVVQNAAQPAPGTEPPEINSTFITPVVDIIADGMLLPLNWPLPID